MRHLVSFSLALIAIVLFTLPSAAQTAQVGADPNAKSNNKLTVEYVGYRQARWEKEHVKELDDSNPNEGGQVSAYLRNNTDRRIQLRFWRLNGQDESYWRVDQRSVWDRTFDKDLDPGEMTVVEINGLTGDFAPEKPFNFAYVDESWLGAGYIQTKLAEDPVQISYVRVLPGLQEIEVFVRHTGAGTVALGALEAVGKQTASAEWVAQEIAGKGMSIARLKLAAPLASAELFILKLALTDAAGERAIYSHRRAFADYFPIGTWGAEEDLRDELHSLHIDTCVQNGNKTDSFYSRDAERLGMKAMVHTGVITNVDQIRELADSPHVACWMIQDEPDWAIPAQQMLLAEQSVRQYNSTIPTFITLCRNVKFFEYAPIADIPCMDHYSVTAPSSSKWPRPWGTRLEETAYYTDDLKAASEPKPIWIWTQGLAGWGERPQRPVPTPSELAAQLVLNLSRGAKGIIWFSYKSDLGAKYPDAREEMRGWGRVMRVLRPDFLASEPAPYAVTAPEKLDTRLLVSRDAAILCVTNLDYEIDPKSYPFVEKKDVSITAVLPPWLQPTAAVRFDAKAATPVKVDVANGAATIAVGDLLDTTLVLLTNDAARVAAIPQEWQALLDVE